MARVEVTAGTVSAGRIQSLSVRISGVRPRTLSRDQAIAWMRDGHSFIPMIDGRSLPALQLVEVPAGDEVERFIRNDPSVQAADTLPFER
jgi:hypothetical protein